MILDYDNELTTAGGQAVTANSIGTKVLDGNKAKDWGAGEPVIPFVRIPEAFNNLTSLQIDFVGADNAALTTNAVVLATKTILLAALTVNSLHAFGSLAAGANKRYFGVKFTVSGTAPTLGKVIAGLTQVDQRPQNGVNSL